MRPFDRHRKSGRDAGLLAGEQRAGAAEADRDFVGDQVHAVPVAGFAQQLQIERVVHAHAGRALHQRFDDHGADLVRVLRQQLAPSPRNARRASVLGGFAGLARVRVGRGHGDHVHQQRLVDLAVQLDVADGQRAERFAVVAVRQRDEAVLRAARGCASSESSSSARLRSRSSRCRRRNSASGRAARGATSRSASCTAGSWVKPAKITCSSVPSCVAMRRVDARVGVAEQVDPPGADGVEVAPAVVAVQPDAFAARDRDHRQRTRGPSSACTGARRRADRVRRADAGVGQAGWTSWRDFRAHVADATTTPRESCRHARFAIDANRGLLDLARTGAFAELRRTAVRRRARSHRHARDQPAARRVRRALDRPVVHQCAAARRRIRTSPRCRTARVLAPADPAQRRDRAVRSVPPPGLARGRVVVAWPRALQ